ncbi:MAG TPA: DUF6519 domain-containing protein [Pyrinomonadaceae bacterium]|jgi:WD40 repeat protein
MKGDFSRRTFDRAKRYSGVLMQQGRVQLDADWNEQLAIHQHRTETETKDVIGLCGVPKNSDGFRLQPVTPANMSATTDLLIFPGRIYVNGLLCEADAEPVAITGFTPAGAIVAHMSADGRAFESGQWVEITGDDEAKTLRLITAVDAAQNSLSFDKAPPNYTPSQHPHLRRLTTYLTQPDLPAPAQAASYGEEEAATLELGEEYYLAYLHVREQHITALEDPSIREKALGGPDTTTRIKNVWQVELLPVAIPDDGALSCETEFPEWTALNAPSTGTLNARTSPADIPTDPCQLPPGAGYRRLENQLYRVEIQKGGERDGATFKWSRENGSIQTTITEINGNIVTVADLGRDEVLGFAGGQWVELVDDESELQGEPRPLAFINSIDLSSREITLDTDATSLAGKKNLRLRRWDQSGGKAGADGLTMSDDWLSLEGGVEVRFSDGTYRAGDYWLIPARTATADIEWPSDSASGDAPLPQPPHGVRQYYCRLALFRVDDAILWLVEDCRDFFPALTDICAEDVCFDNSNCDLPNAETVQDAIEALCGANDLRFHNKHLHGWGIVCGLQVNCGPNEPESPRRYVTVRSGYAIDCEGNDIIHRNDEPVNILEMIQAYNLQHPNAPILQGDGEVCLVLNTDGQNPYALEKYDPAWKSWKSALEGTLFKDFFQDCLGNLLLFFKEELSPKPGEANLLVSPTQKLITSLLNLVVQLFNPTNGRYVYLSGEQNVEIDSTEHTILKNFYEKLRGLLQSHTFCAMFDQATPFPVYPYSMYNGSDSVPTYIPTIFGKGFHRRLRVHPGGKLAYTVGAANKIHVYDLERNEMVEEFEYPIGNAVVRDVAFSPDGNQLYAIATVNNKESSFSVFDVQIGSGSVKHVWRKKGILCDFLLVTLATAEDGKVYGVGRGRGLYILHMEKSEPDATLFGQSFNASGHLVVVRRGAQQFAFATAQEPGNSLDQYNHVRRFNLLNANENPMFLQLQIQGQSVSGQDDIAVASDDKNAKLYVVTNPPSFSDNNHLIIFNNAFSASPPTQQFINLEEKTGMRLAYNYPTQNLMITYSDSYQVRLVGQNNQLVAGHRQAVQIAPTSIATTPDQKRVLVLNYGSNTITSLRADLVKANSFPPLEGVSGLGPYRDQILLAFVDLFGGLLQYLKDCLCDHFLVDCPECDEADKIYLACISIRQEEVYQVCNFSRRKYVKSFPTVEYWLSLVPVIPLVGKFVEQFCCTILPEFFVGKYKTSAAANAAAPSQNKLSSEAMYKISSVLQQTSFGNMFGDALKKFGWIGGQLIGDWFECVFKRQNLPSGEIDRGGEGSPGTTGMAQLSENEMERDPCNWCGNLVRYICPPRTQGEGRDATGASVETDFRRDATFTAASAETVLMERTASGSQTEGVSASEDVLSLRNEMAALREEFARTQGSYAGALAARDATIASLEATTRDLQASLATLSELQEKVNSLTPTRRKPRQRTKKEDKSAQ